MKKILLISSVVSVFTFISFVSFNNVDAQMMGGYYDGDTNSSSQGNVYPGGMMYGYYQNATSTAVNGSASVENGTSTLPMDKEEAEGQVIAQKLQAKTLFCADLSQDNYASLGDYYMGLMMGSSHEAMDNSIEQRYGKDYLNNMHIAMGERFSGCNENVAFPAGMMGFGPMMGGGYNNYQSNWSGYNMMGWGNHGLFPNMFGGYSLGGMVFMIFFWIFAILGLVSVIKWAIKISKK